MLMLGWLIEPLEFEFMRNAIMTAILLGILSAVVGTYLIVQRMGLLGDVIAHAVLPGLAIALRVLLLLVIAFYKELLFYTFDPLGAQASGLPVNAIHFGLMAAITLTIIASMQTVGVVLVVSLLVGPGITAYLLVQELHLMMALGAVIGTIASVSGMYISYT